MLRRYGIKAVVFGVTDKTDFIIIPVIMFFFYGLLSSILNLPFPIILKRPFWNVDILNIIAIVICSISIVWFGITLKVFGKSFRVGIDENTDGKLITNGTFAVSRNPVYTAFIVFFLGLFTEYSNILLSVLIVLLILTIHRQILREEKFLKKRYGTEYEEYCKKVRRYI
jgi:protein-S-isoprenylcysteine O-methyltransferase Ste14